MCLAKLMHMTRLGLLTLLIALIPYKEFVGRRGTDQGGWGGFPGT